MRNIELREHEGREFVLSGPELDALLARRTELSLAIEPAPDEKNADEKNADGKHWRLTPGSTVGALEIGERLSVSIRPKLAIRRVLFLAGYALGEFELRDLERFRYPEAEAPTTALAKLFLAAGQRAFARGLLHGYRVEEEALPTVRGRIRFADQIRRRFGIPLPVEVRYDDFTADVLPNRLVKAAAVALGAWRGHDASSRLELRRIAHRLEDVALLSFSPRQVPAIAFDRLNEHYREVIGLARLILRHATVETGRGRVRAPGFLMDMNRVFERFVRRALREALELSEASFPASTRSLFLDRAGEIGLEPDLAWWEGSRCRFVGDVKYKRIKGSRGRNADLYQLLAYTTALGLPAGLLVYAKGEADPAVHVVRHAGKRLEVRTLDLAGDPPELLAQIDCLAARIRELAARPGRARAA